MYNIQHFLKTFLILCIISCKHGLAVRKEGVCRNKATNNPECCDGYTRDWRSYRIICKPNICEPPCINGWCKKTGDCQCNEGFTASENSHICLPVCSAGCSYGNCTAPDTCQCNIGYKKIGNTCSPMCGLCVDGFCSDPNTCRCNPGYEMTGFSVGFCSPICSDPCVNGYCHAPETCLCNDGYKMIGGTCGAICTEPCVNGMCIAPNECICNRGYKMIDGTCSAICTDPCVNGTNNTPDDRQSSRFQVVSYVGAGLGVLLAASILLLIVFRNSVRKCVKGATNYPIATEKHPTPTSNEQSFSVTFKAIAADAEDLETKYI